MSHVEPRPVTRVELHEHYPSSAKIYKSDVSYATRIT